MPLSKMDSKQQYSNLPNLTAQHQQSTKRKPSYLLSSASRGTAELPTGTALKNHLLQQKAGIYSSRGPAVTEHSNGTCSAYSSPQIPKKEVPRSKDTLDLATSTLTHKALQDIQLRRTTNKNWTFGKYRLRSVDNAADADTLCGLPANIQSSHGRGRLLYTKAVNGNEISREFSSGTGNIQREGRKISHNDLLLSDKDVTISKSKFSHHTINMRRRASESEKVNMAAVAPFRFR